MPRTRFSVRVILSTRVRVRSITRPGAKIIVSV